MRDVLVLRVRGARTLAWSATAVSAAFTVCLVTATCEAQPMMMGQGAGTVPTFTAPPSNAVACASARRVGQVDSGDVCPPSLGSGAGSWTVSRLFPSGPGTPADAGRAFCVYEWTSGTGDPPDTGALPTDTNGNAALEWLHPDCHVVSGLGTHDVLDAVHAEARDYYLAQVEAMPTLPSWSTPATTVAVIDSAIPDYDPTAAGQGAHLHGRHMGLLIRDLACPTNASGDPDCHAELSNHLALNLEAVGGVIEDRTQTGGYFGYQSRLARMIVDAVDAHAAAGTGGRLVLNLSIGWDGTLYNHNEDGTVRASVSSVQVALEYAACNGALVIAAAGNQGGGTAATGGPMYPAAFEQMAIPEHCSAAGEGSYRPLLHSVGGVDGYDQSIANARWGGRPRLAAPAFQASIQEPGPPAHPAALLTGTSMAAAVTSAIAAVAWRVHPTLGPTELISLIYGEGTSLNVAADYCLGGPPCDGIQRASLCRSVVAAVDAVCSGLAGAPPADCNYLPSFDCSAKTAAPWGNTEWSSQTESTVQAVTDHSIPAGPDIRVKVNQSYCSGDVYSVTSNLPPNPCPEEQYNSNYEAPWEITSQPGVPPCGVCALMKAPNGLGDLYIGVNPGLGAEVRDAQLIVRNPSTGDVARYDVDALTGPMHAGETYAVQNLQLIGGATEASMVFTVAGHNGSRHSLKSEILVQTK